MGIAAEVRRRQLQAEEVRGTGSRRIKERWLPGLLQRRILTFIRGNRRQRT